MLRLSLGAMRPGLMQPPRCKIESWRLRDSLGLCVGRTPQTCLHCHLPNGVNRNPSRTVHNVSSYNTDRSVLLLSYKGSESGRIEEFTAGSVLTRLGRWVYIAHVLYKPQFLPDL